jgi:S-adenosyl methyltransferase
VHEVAQRWRPGSRVLYVDNDPIVVAHAQALLAVDSTTIAVNRDLRQPRGILDHPALRALIDFDAPVAVLLVAILHFIGDGDDPYGIVAELMRAMPTGSYLVISHVTGDHLGPAITREVRKLYDKACPGATARSREQIAGFFDGLELIEPGLVSVPSWRNGFVADDHCRVIFYAGAGMKR